MAVLRAMSEGGTQVILTTHSPLVINEMQPNEVTIVTRTPEEGTRFTPLAETPDFEERSRVYAPGELWLSYADGVLEGELVR
jgi:predicted ATP-dependent endonuclease of OLD family